MDNISNVNFNILADLINKVDELEKKINKLNKVNKKPKKVKKVKSLHCILYDCSCSDESD